MKIVTFNKIMIGMVAVSTGLCAYRAKNSYDELNSIKNEIKTKDPARYNRLIQEEKEIDDFSLVWEGERDLMNDSLRMDSVSKKAYFEGEQMVRDSLMNQAK